HSGHPHARPPARALRVRRLRPLPRRGAVARADRRLAPRRGRGPPGPSRRGRRGRTRPLPQPPAARRARRRRRALPRPRRRLALHGSSPEEVERAARGLRSVGFVELAGYLEDPETPDRLAPVALDELEGLLASGAVELLDVREADERDDGYISGSRHLPYRL